jgi:hypothetical protein
LSLIFDQKTRRIDTLTPSIGISNLDFLSEAKTKGIIHFERKHSLGSVEKASRLRVKLQGA